jgi:hypothetical protein
MRRKISWTDGRTEVKQYTPLPLRGAGVYKKQNKTGSNTINIKITKYKSHMIFED